MELELRNPGTKTFIDCDDLTDLTRLFSYVGQDWRGRNVVLDVCESLFVRHFSEDFAKDIHETLYRESSSILLRYSLVRHSSEALLQDTLRVEKVEGHS